MFQRLVQITSLLALLALTTTATAQTVHTGQTEGGAFFAIIVPPNWNGDLVVWNHGYQFSPIAPVNPSLDPIESDMGPLAPLQLAQGYAVAASSYQQNQWAVFTTRDDLEELIDAFEDNVAEPNNIILTGASLGGIVTADALERADIDNVVGAYPFCGALAGSRIWDGALDIRLTYDAVCSSVAPIPGGATGLPEGFPPLSNVDVALATHACMGTLAADFGTAPTAAQQARMDQFLAVTKIPENFIITDLFFAVNGISNLIFDPRKLDGEQGLGNNGVKYDDPAVDASIQRVRADRGAAKKLKRNFTPTGDLEEEDVKIVSIHTDKDGLVIVENEKEYQDVVDSDNLTVAIVVEAAPTHCGFSEAEGIAGWESLKLWIAGSPQPNAAVLQATCVTIAGRGLASGPCRFNPSFVIPDMDGRIAPRGKMHGHDDD